jgi:pSer/pThr/pTyr-binding forkhead associated (FHA) protein
LDDDPIAVLLKFAFLGVLYLFLLWVARSSLKDLRRPSPAREEEDLPEAATAEPAARHVLVVEAGGGLRRGAAFDVDGSLTIGRSPQMAIQIDDRFASGRHARVYERNGLTYVEDMGSTNGTYLNGRRLGAQELLRADDRIRIGDTEFRYEQR